MSDTLSTSTTDAQLQCVAGLPKCAIWGLFRLLIHICMFIRWMVDVMITGAHEYPINDSLIIDYRTDILQQSELCGDFEHYTLARFIFLTASSVIAFLGTIYNLLLVYIFTTRSYPNTPSTHYPTVLAILDTLICALYIMLFGIDAAIVYLKNESLFIVYHIYIVPAFVISRITQLAIPYMLIFGTLERLVWISGDKINGCLKQMYSIRGRHLTMILSLLCCILLRSPTAFAVVVHYFPNCTDFLRSQSTGPADWVHESSAYYFFDFHLLSIAQTLVPFIVLLVCNFIIIKKLLQNDAGSEDDNQSGQKSSREVLEIPLLPVSDDSPSMHKHSASFNWIKRKSIKKISNVTIPLRKMTSPTRSAIYTTLAIVTSYLVSNSLHLVLTILERSKSSILRDPYDPMMASTFHTVFSDTVSFVYMFTSAIRLIIYYICNPAIRDSIKNLSVCQWLFTQRKTSV